MIDGDRIAAFFCPDSAECEMRVAFEDQRERGLQWTSSSIGNSGTRLIDREQENGRNALRKNAHAHNNPSS
jgi:hypothetical protein